MFVGVDVGPGHSRVRFFKTTLISDNSLYSLIILLNISSYYQV